MNEPEWQIKRVVVIAQDWNERALIAAQLQQQVSYRAQTAATLEEGLAHMVLRVALIIVDWSNLEIPLDLWSRFLTAARGAPILILARKIDREELAKLGIESKSVLFRPFTIGDVIHRALETQREERSHDGADGREQAAD